MPCVMAVYGHAPLRGLKHFRVVGKHFHLCQQSCIFTLEPDGIMHFPGAQIHGDGNTNPRYSLQYAGNEIIPRHWFVGMGQNSGIQNQRNGKPGCVFPE